MLAFFVIALCAALINYVLIFPVLCAAILWYSEVVLPSFQDYADGVNQANLECTICQKMAMCSLTIDDLIPVTPEIIARAGLMPCGDDEQLPLLFWGIYGEKRDFRISMCEATIPQSFQYPGSQKRGTYVSSGIWVHIDLAFDTQQHYKLLDEKSVPAPVRSYYFSKNWGFEEAPIDNPDLAKHFLLYRPKNTSQNPSPMVLQCLKDLAEHTSGHVALGLHGSQLDIFVQDRSLSCPVPLFQPPTQEMLELDPFPEFNYIFQLALEMG